MEEKISAILKLASEEINACTKEADLLNVKSKYLGKTSEMGMLLSSLKDFSIEDKKKYGSLINNEKKNLEKIIDDKLLELNTKINYKFDPTLPVYEELGSMHPITVVAKEVTDIMQRMGFTIVTGPEMETDYYNFEALNVPKNHPARDMQDTYYLSNGMLLRTQTSTNQVRAMQKYGAPIKICAPGRVFRNEDLDACHENTFFQLEGMVIDEDISINNLIYVVKGFLKEIFKQDLCVRLRPGYFPFTEPSFELDCSCTVCGGKGCPTCKNSGWLELCPCGMIHPNVLKESGIDPDKYSGFAFGLGLARLVMMKYKMGDIRVLNSGDLRYLKEFGEE